VTAFLLEPTRSGQVPRDFFAPREPEGTPQRGPVCRLLRAAGFGLAAPTGPIAGAIQRRDFVNLGQGTPRWAGWAGPWVERINRLFASNGQRRQAWFQKQTQPLAALEAQVRRQVQEMKEVLDRELAAPQLAPEPQKGVAEPAPAWPGLTVFVEPSPSADGQQRRRAGPTGRWRWPRKNFYGSGASGVANWPVHASRSWPRCASIRICPQRYSGLFRRRRSRQGGRVPAELEEFLLWKWSAQKRAAWTTPEHRHEGGGRTGAICGRE